MLQVTGLDQTIQILLDAFESFETEEETIPIADALGREVAQTVAVSEDMPPYNRSIMDGYAVHAADTFGASAAIPAMLDIAGSIEMGEYVMESLPSGSACRIPTGGMLPSGANGVVMVEYTEEMDDSTVLIEKSIAPGENMIRKGEDSRAGDILFNKGHLLRAQDIGALASLGMPLIDVKCIPKIGIVSTGNEIVQPFGEVLPGKIRDVNTYALAAAAQRDGFMPKMYGIVPDDFEHLRNALALALAQNDVVLISGGSSVGVMDMTLRVIGSMENAHILIQGIALKPGKPTIAARVQNKPVFGLPGHPVSAFIVYHTVILPFLYGLMQREKQIRSIDALFAENYATQQGRDEYILVKLKELDGRMVALPLYAKSGMFITITAADGLVRVPASKEGLYENEQVRVELL